MSVKPQWNLILKPRQAELWERYVAAETNKEYAIALQRANAFAEAMQSASPAVCDHFAETVSRLAVEGEINFVLRRPVVRQILFPFLIRSYQEGLDAAPFWIIRFYSELCQITAAERSEAPEDVPLFDAFALLREGVRRNPKNPAFTRAVAERFLQQAESGFSYAVHEVPAGVLFGTDGASAAECRELFGDLQLSWQMAEKWDLLEKYRARFEFYDYHFRGYADYLENYTQYQNYADYIERHPFSG